PEKPRALATGAGWHDSRLDAPERQPRARGRAARQIPRRAPRGRLARRRRAGPADGTRRRVAAPEELPPDRGRGGGLRALRAAAGRAAGRADRPADRVGGRAPAG